MTVWPATLPLPLLDASGQPRHATLTSSLENVKIQRRSRFYAAPVILQVRWVLSIAEMDAFEAFFETDLDNGAGQFTIDLKYPKTSETSNWKVRFLEGYASSYAESRWEVEGTFELLQPELPPAAPVQGFEIFYATDGVNDDIPFVLVGGHHYTTKQ